MIAIRTKNLSPLFKDLLGIGKFLRSIPGVSLVVSPGDGVDWDLSGAIPEDIKVYSLIPHVKGADLTIRSQCLVLGIPDLVPLFPIHMVSPDLGDYGEMGVYDVSGVEDLYRFERILERKPSMVRVSINPLKYPKDVLIYCKDNDIPVLGADIFGGDLYMEYYRGIFPETFLQAFGEHNTDVIEVPGEDPYLIRRVWERQGTGLSQTSLLEYSQALDKSPSLPYIGRKIWQTVEVKVPGIGEVYVEGEEGEFTLQPPSPKIDLGEPLWTDDILPDDVPPADKDLLGVLHRYHVLPRLQEEKLWKPVFTRISPDFWAIKMIPRVGLFWKEKYYWLISGKLYKIPLSGAEILTNDGH